MNPCLSRIPKPVSIDGDPCMPRKATQFSINELRGDFVNTFPSHRWGIFCEVRVQRRIVIYNLKRKRHVETLRKILKAGVATRLSLIPNSRLRQNDKANRFCVKKDDISFLVGHLVPFRPVAEATVYRADSAESLVHQI